MPQLTEKDRGRPDEWLDPLGGNGAVGSTIGSCALSVVAASRHADRMRAHVTCDQCWKCASIAECSSASSAEGTTCVVTHQQWRGALMPAMDSVGCPHRIHRAASHLLWGRRSSSACRRGRRSRRPSRHVDPARGCVPVAPKARPPDSNARFQHDAGSQAPRSSRWHAWLPWNQRSRGRRDWH